MGRILEGYTQLPNDILEILARTELSPYQHRVLMVIIRMTFGWHKDADRIANRQFRNATGIKDRANICRSVKKLEQRHIIVVSRDYEDAATYRINGNLAEWELSSTKTTLSKKRIRRSFVVDRDYGESSGETTLPASTETTEASSVETPSEYTRKENKEMKDTAAQSASFFSSGFRNEDSDAEPRTNGHSLMAEYLDWKAKNREDIPFLKWMNRYA